MDDVRNHLYWITYYLKFNEKPWKEYSHGWKGYIELIEENPQKYSSVKTYVHKNISKKKYQSILTSIRRKKKI